MIPDIVINGLLTLLGVLFIFLIGYIVGFVHGVRKAENKWLEDFLNKTEHDNS